MKQAVKAGTCRLFHWAHRLRAFETLQVLGWGSELESAERTQHIRPQVLPTAGAYDVETFMPSTGEKVGCFALVKS